MKTTDSAAGILILIMILGSVAGGLVDSQQQPVLLWIAGGAAWLAAFLLVPNTAVVLRLQVGIMLLAGLGLIFYAKGQGAAIDWLKVVSSNAGLLTMIAAVGFLKLVALPQTATARQLPVGPKAYLQTLLGVSVFASVINVSAPILIADRIHQQRPLTRFSSQSITRVFCGMSNWSPFFGAMAAVLTYVSEASLAGIMLAGLPIAIVGVLVVLLEAKWRYQEEIDSFVGYPMRADALLIPLILMVLVAGATWLFPNVSILIIIALSALTVTIILYSLRHGAGLMVSTMSDYVIIGLPRMVSELSLFLAAGVLAVGMSAMIDIGVVTSPFDHFDSWTAVQVLAIMLLCAALGIHPIIMISSFTPMLLELDPNPTLLALVYLIAWNLGTGSSFLSGTHLVFQSRYQIPSWKAAMWNWPYALFMFALVVIWLQFVGKILVDQVF